MASSAFNWFSYDITSNSRIGGTIFDGTENDLKPCYPGQVLDPNDCQKKAIRGLSIWDAFVTVDDAVKTNLIQNTTSINIESCSNIVECIDNHVLLSKKRIVVDLFTLAANLFFIFYGFIQAKIKRTFLIGNFILKNQQ